MSYIPKPRMSKHFSLFIEWKCVFILFLFCVCCEDLSSHDFFPLSIPLPLLFILTFKVPDIAGKLLYVDYLDLGVVVHACNTNTWEAEAKGTLRV